MAIDQDAGEVLRAMVQMSPLPMVLADVGAPDYPLVFANPAFLTLTGYEASEVLGRNCRFLQGPKTDPEAVTLLRRAVAEGREAMAHMWNYRKDGSAFWNAMYVGPVKGEDGTILYWFGCQLDATTKYEAEQAREQAQRLDTLGAMAAGAAHEFNNLMTVALGNAERMATEALTPRQIEWLGRIEWAARSAGRLTQQMLSFAQRQSLHAEIVDLNAVLAGLDRLLAQVAAPGIFVETVLGSDSLGARLDIGQLELALINLVRNASDASAPGMRIIVSSGKAIVDGEEMVEIRVTDTGSGMPEGVRDRAADPFFTTKVLGRGTGLGLSMVAGFCRQSGGRLAIESEAGFGSTVRLLFPSTR